MKILFSLLSILIVVIAGLLVAPSFIDFSKYKVQIKEQVEKATGYQLDLNGAVSASIIPFPQVTVENVAIDSAGAKSPVAFKGTADKLSVAVELIPLLSGNIKVNEVTLIKPIVTLREVAQPTAEQKKLEAITSEEFKESKSQPNISLDELNIENASITYKPLSGDSMVVDLPKMILSAESLKGPFNYDGRIKYDTFNVAVKGSVGEMAEGQPLTITTSIDGGAYALNYNGLVDTSKDVPEVQGELSVRADSIQSLASQFGAEDIAIKDQSFALTGLIAGTTKVVRLDNGELSLGNASQKMPVKFNFATEVKKGSVKIQSLPGGGLVDLDIAMGDKTTLNGQIALNNIKTLASDVLGVVGAKTFDNPQMPNSVSGDINASLGDVMTLISKSLMVGDYKLAGTNVSYITGDKPKVDVKIDNFEGAKIAASGTLDMEQGVNVSVSHPNAVQFIRVFQKDFQSSPNLTKPFSFSGLVKQDGDTIMVSNMASKIGVVDAKGALSINNAGAVPSIKADLEFGTLDTQALATGKTSSAAAGGGSAGSSKSSGGAPWTRDAIDTSALRAINIDLNAKAKTLVHGTWVVSNPTIDINLNNGVLDINTIKGGMFGGGFDMSGKVTAKAEGQPLSITSTINANNFDLSKFVKAALSQNKERVTGKGSLNLNLSASGLSSSALIYSLNGDGQVTAGDLVVKGIDLAKVTEAISDESLTDLAAVVQGAFKTGQTPFNPIDHTITIREGTMPVNNFTLVSPTASLISNGTVSFSNWNMDVKNTVDFTNPDDLPNVDMTIKGPLDAPKQSVASDVLRSFIMNKYGAKIQNKVDKLLGDKLKDTPAAGLINNLLGLPQKQVAPVEQAPAANDNQVAPAPAEEQPQPKIEEQLIRGLFDQLAK